MTEPFATVRPLAIPFDTVVSMSPRMGARFWRRSALTLGLSVAAASAVAQEDPNPYYVGISQSFTKQANLFGSQQGTPKVGDVYSSTALLFGLDQPFGRQRLFVDGQLRANRYEDVKLLDNEGYSLSAGLNWSTIERLSGVLRVSADRSLADYTSADAPRLTDRNLRTTHQLEATARYGLAARMSLNAGYEHRGVKFSAPQFVTEELTQNVGRIGIRYGTEGHLVVGAGVRFSEADTPQARETAPGSGVYDANSVRRRDLELTADWTPTGLSTIAARLAFGRQTQSLSGQPAFSGVTGSLGWQYQPTAKLTFNTQLSRDTGTETAFRTYSPGTPNAGLDSFDANRVTNSADLRVDYDPTAKVRVYLTGRYARSASDAGGTDNTRTMGLGLSYDPLRSVTLGCSALHTERRTNAGWSFGYSDEIFSCFGSLTLR